jgi:pre-mRNA-splicing helicase BRR2
LKKIQLQNEICYEKVIQRAGKHKVLIFVHSRAETVKTARALVDMVLENGAIEQFVPEGSSTSEILREEAENCKSPDLADLLVHGFAIHHAGMARADRNLVEDLFAAGELQVLVSTATLAWGVNLPAHTVILKGTQMYDPEQGQWTELSPLDIMQMMGRAGRFGLDSEGEGIIITQHAQLQYYLSLMNQQLPIESQFIARLPDQLNAEIAMGSVQNLSDAADWLAYTYLYVRMLRNPSLYGAGEEEIRRDPTLRQRRIDLVHAAASMLDRAKLIRYDRKGGIFHITNLGKVASHYYITHDSMTVYNNNLKPQMSDIEVLRLFSLSDEFKNVHVRQEERLELEKLMQRVPIPVKESAEEGSAKVNVLLQAYVARLCLDGFALMSDMAYVQQSAVRIFRALFDIALRRGWGSLSFKLLTFSKMVERRLWLSQSPLRQFPTVPDVICKKLEKHSDVSWSRYYDLAPQDLGEMVRIPKMGKTLHKYVHSIPRVQLSAVALPITRSLLKIELSVTPDFNFDEKLQGFLQLFWVIVTDVNDELILHHEPFMLKSVLVENEHLLSFTVPLHDPMPPQYFVHVVSDKWLHSETVIPLSFRHLILPSRFYPHTELLDMQPLPVRDLGDQALRNLYPTSMGHFNPIQTQTFHALFEKDNNVFVGAPPGSGTIVCAEFAIMRAFSQNENARCVYVALKEEVVDQIFFSWELRFGRSLGKTVVKIESDDTHNMKKLADCHIAVASAEAWDRVSRRWRRRKVVKAVDLFICDNLHLIGSEQGHLLEAVVSRMRFMASQLKEQLSHHLRIVGLSASVANGKDLGDWMGVKSSDLFNFGLSVRPLPLEVHVHGFDIAHFTSRMLAMARPTFNAILAHARSPKKNAIVFVPSRKQAQVTSVDLIMYGNSYDEVHGEENGGEGTTLFPSSCDVSALSDQSLAHVMSQGVAYFHHGLSKADKVLVLHAFSMGHLRVLVAPFSMAWEIDIPSNLVVVMGTETYDGRERRYTDVPAAELIQMVGLASRASSSIYYSGMKEEDEEEEDEDEENVSKCVVLCHTPKKEFLKRILHHPLPVESHLDHFLHDHLNAEIVSNTVQGKGDAVDYLTWTFLFRRIAQNPNYYHMHGKTRNHISDFLSELVENVVTDLEESHCLLVEDETEVSPLNLGLIAAYYHTHYTTAELFASSITPKTRVKGLLDILSSASEFSSLPMRHREDKILGKVAAHLPQKLPSGGQQEDILSDPATKVHILLQMHFSRLFIPSPDLRQDLTFVLTHLPSLVHAIVDVIASSNYLKPALAAMEFCQMVVQGVWNKDSPLLQVPHFTPEIVAACEQHNPPVESVLDIVELEDDVRERLLPFSEESMSDVAIFCNSYPSIDVSFDLPEEEIIAGDSARLTIRLARDEDEEDEEEEEEEEEEDDENLGVVLSLRYPEEVTKSEQWWVVLGDLTTNSLLGLKRIPLRKRATVPLDFTAPEEAGDHSLTLFVMCDSYRGCDQEYEVNLSVLPDEGSEEED